MVRLLPLLSFEFDPQQQSESEAEPGPSIQKTGAILTRACTDSRSSQVAKRNNALGGLFDSSATSAQQVRWSHEAEEQESQEGQDAQQKEAA